MDGEGVYFALPSKHNFFIGLRIRLIGEKSIQHEQVVANVQYLKIQRVIVEIEYPLQNGFVSCKIPCS